MFHTLDLSFGVDDALSQASLQFECQFGDSGSTLLNMYGYAINQAAGTRPTYLTPERYFGITAVTRTDQIWHPSRFTMSIKPKQLRLKQQDGAVGYSLVAVRGWDISGTLAFNTAKKDAAIAQLDLIRRAGVASPIAMDVVIEGAEAAANKTYTIQDVTLGQTDGTHPADGSADAEFTIPWVATGDATNDTLAEMVTEA